MNNSQNWPLQKDYASMLQNPIAAFRDSELKRCAIQTLPNMGKQPWLRSGAFAVVCRGTYPSGGHVAIRAFIQSVPERRERYDLIHGFLLKQKLRCVVRFEYTDGGIRSTDGRWYPLVTMEWVTGTDIFKWLSDRCKANDKQALKAMVEKWIELVGELRAAGIAHGDLQQGNILVNDKDALKLVDYDCMYVPTMGNGRRNLEIGVNPYQHPERDATTLLSPELDNFSALFILVALKAISVQPQLWHEYVEKANYDKLLITDECLASPSSSPLGKALLGSPDREVQQLAEALFEAYRGPLDSVPPIEQILFSYDKVEQLLDQKAWDAAVELLNHANASTNPPAALEPRIVEVKNRVAWRQQLETAVEQDDEVQMERLYREGRTNDFINGYPEAEECVEVAAVAGDVLAAIDVLEELKGANQWIRFVESWESLPAIIKSRQSTQAYREAFDYWHVRSKACKAVLQEYMRAEPDYDALESAWRELESHGGHPEADKHEQRIVRTIEQHRVWSGYCDIPKDVVTSAVDEQRDKAWDDKLFSDWEPAAAERPRIHEARQRLRTWKEVREEIHRAKKQPSVKAEQNIIAMASGLPIGYDDDLSERVELAKQRCQCAEVLQESLSSGSDIRIYEAFEQLETVGGYGLITAKRTKERIELAKERYPHVIALQSIPKSAPLDVLDTKLLEIWKGREGLLQGCRDAKDWQDAYSEAIQRKEVLDQLEAGIRAADYSLIAELVEHPLLQNYRLPGAWSSAIHGSLEQIAKAKRILHAIKQKDRARFQELFDVRCIREFPQLFSGERAGLRELVETEIAKSIDLGSSFFQEVQRAGVNGTYRIRWHWPQPRFSDRCVLALCRNRPRRGSTEKDWHVYWKVNIDRRTWQNSGGIQPVHIQRHWGRPCVVVKALIELGDGLGEVESSPFVLGRIG